MVGPVLLGLGLLGGFLLLAHWYVNAEPRKILRSLRWILLGVLGALIIGMAVSGRLGWALGLMPLLIAWAPALFRAARAAKNYARMSGMKGGARSKVETAALRMTLDTDTGDLSGEVIAGPHAGTSLADLALEDLVDLLRHYDSGDVQSARILTAYLDRRFPDWRQTAAGARADSDETAGWGSSTGGSDGDMSTMTRGQALSILGLDRGASEMDIKAAHHRLIAALHPDRGGTSYLAAQINRAKDVLLGKN